MQVCKARPKAYAKIAPNRCRGSAVERWAAKAQAMAIDSVGDAGGHKRVLSGDLMWCIRCGSYASSVAKGLSKPCLGKFEGRRVRGGLLGQLKVLQSGRHPVTLEPIPQPVAVAALAGDGSSSQHVSIELDFQSFHRDLKPQVHLLTAAQRRTALLQRVQAKEAASKAPAGRAGDAVGSTEVAGTALVRRRITGKRPLAPGCGLCPSGKRQRVATP